MRKLLEDQFKVYLHIDLRCFDANISDLAITKFFLIMSLEETEMKMCD